MTLKNKNVNETGPVARDNKAKSKLKRFGITPEDTKNPSFRPKKNIHGNDILSSRQASHRAKRGVKTKGHFNESLKNAIIEGLTKKMNKEKKRNFEIEQGKKMVKSERYKKSPVDLLKAHRTGKVNKAFESIIKERYALLVLEKSNDVKTDLDSITGAGGDADTYASIKASKDKKRDSASNNYPTRREVLGKLGGYKDKKGNNPVSKTNSGTANFKKGVAQKPLPLNVKGKPGKGKKSQNVRGKSVNTSRSTGSEGMKSDLHARSFDKLVTSLSKTRK